MLKTSDRLNAFDIDYYIQLYSNDPFSCVCSDEESQQLIRELFRITDVIEPIGEDDKKSFWIMAPRGSFEQFREECCDGENEEEDRRWFLEEYPNEVKWYRFTSVKYKDTFGVFINNSYVLSINDINSNGFPEDTMEFTEWLIQGAQNAISALKKGDYNSFVNDNLPAKYRYGRISRKDYWDTYPELRNEYRGSFTEDEIKRFIEYAENNDCTPFRNMTSGDYYRACEICYKAAGYEINDNLTPKELYFVYADGRDDNLSAVPEDDDKAFDDWLCKRGCYEFNGGHPWEIRASFSIINSIHLYVAKEEHGKVLILTGETFGSSVETVKMYLALRDAGIPVRLTDYGKDELIKRFTEEDDIGVLPEWVSLFGAQYGNSTIGADVNDFTQLCFREKIEEKVKWIEETEIKLK